MVADGLRPDTWTYAKIIGIAASLKQIDKVMQYRDDMLEQNIPYDAVIYNHLIAIFAAHGQEQAAYELYQQMLAENNVPVASTFGLLMNTFRKNDAIFEGIWADMQRLGVRPDGAGFNLVLTHEGFKPGNFAKAKALFDDYLAAHNPDVRCYTIMISIATAHRQARIARDLVQDMRTRGMRLDVPGVNAVLNVLALEGEVSGAEKLYEDMKRNQMMPTVATQRIMMKTYAMAGAISLRAYLPLNGSPFSSR